MHSSVPRCILKYYNLGGGGCVCVCVCVQNTATSLCSRCVRFSSQLSVLSPELVRKMHNAVEDRGFV